MAAKKKKGHKKHTAKKRAKHTKRGSKGRRTVSHKEHLPLPLLEKRLKKLARIVARRRGR